MQGFARLPSRTVTLTHGEESVVFTLAPPPLGYFDTVEMLLPPPAPAPLKKDPDPAALAKWTARKMFLILGRALGDQLSAAPPLSGAGATAWAAYADSIAAEFEAAMMLDGDVSDLWNAVVALRRGIGDLPKT